MNYKTYIHYGSPKFSKRKFKKIKNDWSKPNGGLWASPTNTDFGWRDWCESQQFRKCEAWNSFRFRLKEKAKVLTVTKVEDVNDYIIKDQFCYSRFNANLDFEKMIKDGYDAIELIHGDNYRELHFSLFNSWDCDSICIFNPKIMEFV